MPDSLEELVDTRAALQRAVDTVLPLAKKEIGVFDADLRNLEFDARGRADMISAFLAGGRDRSVRMVLHELDHVTRYSPRLVGLLKRYSHCFSIRQTPESLRNLADAFVLADGVSGVIRFHADHFRGKLLLEQAVAGPGVPEAIGGVWGGARPGGSGKGGGL